MSPYSSDRMEQMEVAFAAHEDPALFLQLADAYRQAGDRERALRVLRRGLERHPGSAEASLLLARVLVDGGREAEAALVLDRLLEQDRDHAEARLLRQGIRVTPATSTPPSRPTPPFPVASAAMESLPWEPANGAEPAAVNGTVSPPLPASPAAAAPAYAPVRPEPRPAEAEASPVALAELLVSLLEHHDPCFRGGSSLTRLLSAAIARELKLDDALVRAIGLGAVLRDLGQLALRPQLGTTEELGEALRRKLERHGETTLELLSQVKLPRATIETIRYHHERWDGRGYPAHLAAHAIPLGARILAVADAFAAMIAARPHRLPRRPAAALAEVRALAGSQFDPAVVTALARVLDGGSWKGPGFALRQHVLLVDGDHARALVLATRLGARGCLVESATDLRAAEERLAHTQPAALIISGDLPREQRLRLLRHVRENPRTSTVPVIVPDTDAAERVALLEEGADVCLQRGGSPAELDATLNAFFRREGRLLDTRGVTSAITVQNGDVRQFPLALLLQLLAAERRSAAVFLDGEADEGAVYLEQGTPVHARTRTLSGEPALHALLQWPRALFTLDPDPHPPEHTIRKSLPAILMQQSDSQSLDQVR